MCGVCEGGGVYVGEGRTQRGQAKAGLKLMMSPYNQYVLKCISEKKKWCIVSVYRLPDSCVNKFIENLCIILDKCQRESNMIIIIGDVNIDMSKTNSKSEKLSEILNLYSLCNKINEPTCFKGNVPSVIDLCIVSQPKRFTSILNCMELWFKRLAQCYCSCHKVKDAKDKE